MSCFSSVASLRIWCGGMIPNVADRGTSFAGVSAYLLHDKKDDEAEEYLYTSDRVEWTTTRNFYKTDLDPEIAGKVMAATAMDQDRLKRQAGIRKSGQQSKGAVYHYSIAWHPEESGKIDKAEMLKAAEQSLEAIGAQDRQTMIVCHNDEDHPHVHLVVNLVSQDDGRNLSLHADYNKLEAWALDYRRARGEELKYVPSREEKAQAKEATKRGETVDFVRGQKSVPRHMLKDYEQARKADPKAAERVLNKQRQLDKDLAQKSIKGRETRAQDVNDLEARLKVELKDINRHADSAVNRAEDLVDKQYEPQRTEHAARHFKERQGFEKREERLAGKIQNAVSAIRHRREIDPEGSRGAVGDAFNYLTNRKARAEALDKLHRIEDRHLTKAQREEIGAAKNKINGDRSALLSQAKTTFNSDRIAMLERQAKDKMKVKAAWDTRSDERKRAFDAIVKKAEMKKSAKARPESQSQARKDFNRAAEGAPRKRSKGRSRKRTYRGD